MAQRRDQQATEAWFVRNLPPDKGGRAPRHWRDVPLWKNVSDEDWHDWQWQLAHRVTTAEDLAQVVPITDADVTAINQCLALLRMAISPYYATLIDPDDPDCPIRKQAVPDPREMVRYPEDLVDPLAEEVDSPVRGLTHRYPDRVLLLVSDCCTMYCRHCTRRRWAGQEDRARTWAELEEAVDYIRRTPQVRDVLVSGGDPLTLSDAHLERLLAALRAIDHVEIIRLGTRAPVVLPQRITPALVEMLQRFHPLWINVQFNHPREVTREAAAACGRLTRAGIPLGNQSVLLRGINDCATIMRELVHALLRIRVRPYYLYQCDLSVGIEHFRTSIGKGLEIIELLRGHTSGMAVPTFVVDAPAGAGKIPIMPHYLVTWSTDKVIMRNYEGFITAYTEPADYVDPLPTCPGCLSDAPVGVARLMHGRVDALRPVDSERLKRRDHFHA